MSLSASQKQEIKELRSHAAHTFRPTVSALEAILFEPLQVLDHGFVRVVDYMGNDAAIVQAARVSYGAGTKQISEDRGLIHYLMRHWHTTPFEMCEIKLHVKLPIFIARQWLRHRTANVNEYSGRYSIMDREFYVPDVDTLAPQSALNKQGRDANTLSASESAQVLEILKNDSSTCYQHYIEMLNIDEETQQVIDPSRCGLTRELARMNLTLNYYTQFYWKIDLHNMMHFLRLRADDHAQFEIRAYAKVMLDIMQKWTPLTYEAFLDYRLNAVNLSSKALELIKRKLTGQAIAPEDVGMSKREWRELKDLFGDAL